MMFGDQTNASQAAEIIAATRDAGINAIDTANAYAGGESERITGKLIAVRPRALGAGDQAREPDGARAERPRALAPPHHGRG